MVAPGIHYPPYSARWLWLLSRHSSSVVILARVSVCVVAALGTPPAPEQLEVHQGRLHEGNLKSKMLESSFSFLKHLLPPVVRGHFMFPLLRYLGFFSMVSLGSEDGVIWPWLPLLNPTVTA